MQRKEEEKKNIFSRRVPIVATVNDKDSEIPIFSFFSSEELFHPKDHFLQTEEVKALSRSLLLAKKGKMYGFNEKGQPTTKVTSLADSSITIFGNTSEISPVSIMQRKELFQLIKENAIFYLNKVVKPLELQLMVKQLYDTIKNTNPHKGETIHLATTERDLRAPDAGKNRLVAEYSALLAKELHKLVLENNHTWKIEIDRVLAIKQRTSRAESYGIHRIAQQPLMLYQSRKYDEKTLPKEKVLLIDDHIQAGAAISCAATQIIDRGAHLIGVACISIHKNSKYFNIQADVKKFIISLLPRGFDDLPKLNEKLGIVGLSIETLTNFEGFILAAILSDPKDQALESKFKKLLEKYDASDAIYARYKNQKNSLMDEFYKPKLEFDDFEKELLLAIKNGRFTIDYKEEIILSDQDGQKIRDEVDARSKLPWILFDFDDTLQEITKAYEACKNLTFFAPKMTKEDFLALRKKYRIGIICDSTLFENTLKKIETFYGVHMDGCIHPNIHRDFPLPKKPNPSMYHEFCKKYNIKEKPIAYVGDNKDIDGRMADHLNLRFIEVDSSKPSFDMAEFKKKLSLIEEQRHKAKENWRFIKNTFKKPKKSVVKEDKISLSISQP